MPFIWCQSVTLDDQSSDSPSYLTATKISSSLHPSQSLVRSYTFSAGQTWSLSLFLSSPRYFPHCAFVKQINHCLSGMTSVSVQPNLKFSQELITETSNKSMDKWKLAWQHSISYFNHIYYKWAESLPKYCWVEWQTTIEIGHVMS